MGSGYAMVGTLIGTITSTRTTGCGPIAAPFAAAGNGRDSVQPSSFLFDIRVRLLSVANKEENVIRSPPSSVLIHIGETKALLAKTEGADYARKAKF